MSLTDDLERLDQLKTRGAITDGEFQAAKAAVLSGAPSSATRPSEPPSGRNLEKNKTHPLTMGCAIMFVAPPILFFIAVVAGAGSDSRAPRTKQRSPPTASPVAVTSVRTARGTFSVPGKGFTDGTDSTSQPPVTVMNINAWDAVPRTRAVCRIPHGTPVTIVEARHEASEDRHYFRVQSSSSCVGWIPETFIGTRRVAPIGDKM